MAGTVFYLWCPKPAPLTKNIDVHEDNVKRILSEETAMKVMGACCRNVLVKFLAYNCSHI